MGPLRRSWPTLALLALLQAVWLKSVAYLLPSKGAVTPATSTSSRSAHAGGPGRREALASAAALVAMAGAQGPAHAEQPWQLKLPRTWQLFSQNQPPPPGDNRPIALIVAGDEAASGDLSVLRVPLVDAGGDVGKKELIDYFSTPAGKSPSVSQKEVVEALVKSQRTQPGLTRLDLQGQPVEKIRSGRRYVSYEYDSELCQGQLVKGAGGKSRCELPDGNGELPLLNRRHSITMTVVKEADADVQALWLVDVSAPTDSWATGMAGQAKDLSESFEVGSEEQLEKDRDAYIEAVNAETQKLAAQLAKEEEAKKP